MIGYAEFACWRDGGSGRVRGGAGDWVLVAARVGVGGGGWISDLLDFAGDCVFLAGDFALGGGGAMVASEECEAGGVDWRPTG